MAPELKKWIKSNFPALAPVLGVVSEYAYYITHPVTYVKAVLICKKLGNAAERYVAKNNLVIISSFDELIRYADEPFWRRHLINKYTKSMFDNSGTCYIMTGSGGLMAIVWCVCKDINNIIRPFSRNFDFSKFSYIHKLMVSPRFRRQGIGEQLVNSVVDILRREGHDNVIALVRVENNPSLRLFEKIGFKECGRISTLKLLNLEFVAHKSVINEIAL